MERDAPRPACFQVQDDAFRTGWLPVKYDLTARELDTELSTRGWTFFYMANVIRKISLRLRSRKGYFRRAEARHGERQRGAAAIVSKLIAVETHSFFGIPYVSVSAHPRHIQKGMVFSPHSQPSGAKSKPLELRPQKIGA